MNIEKIYNLANESEREVAKICSELVQINSSHPNGFTDDVVEYIRDYLNLHGIKNEVHAKNNKKPNIVAKLQGKSDITILWVGHIDVVPEGKPENWTYPPYSGKIADDCVWGRGSSDMKGACASAMVSAGILNDMQEIPHNVEFWFTSDEEIGGGAGARWLAESGMFKGNVCIIGDGNGGGPKAPSIDLGCKGGAGVKLIARGRTAHGSTPFLGENAITKLINGVPWVEKIDDYKLDFPSELEPLIKGSVNYYKQTTPSDLIKQMEKNFYTPSVTCNIIEGGVKINVVPDYAEAQFDIRLTPGSKPYDVIQMIKKYVEDSGIKGLEVIPSREIIVPEETAGYYEVPNSNFAIKFRDLLKEVTGKDVNMKILTGGTDGISTSKIAGIPSLGYGTSLTGQAHQPDERITIENLVLGIKVYTAFPLTYKL
ncbi:ArgE/DapE family deacylase [Candidatus Bathyarchaeota archaeon]|nr:ArgE/DapE family deacylase [Candidatus Bathyarchaeota archaeon]